MAKFPCYKCEQRHVGCHSSCEQYNQFKVLTVEQRKEITRETYNNYTIRDNRKKQDKTTFPW